MGQSSSTPGFNLQQYQYLNQIIDPRFGNIKLYQKNETGETICIIEKNFIQINNPIKNLDHPNILKVHYYKADICKNICSSFTKLQLIQEYVSNELRSNIKNRANKQQYFEEKQLWGLLSMCLKALMYFKSFQIYPMDLKNILLSNQGTIKFQSYYDISNSQYMQLLNQITEDIHISPEELECLKLKEQVLNLDFEKCEIFQLGLTALWSATLADTNSLFSYDTLNYSEYEMKQRIEELNYSQQFKNILLKMLKRFPQDRGSFNELLQVVSYHECNENLLEIKPLNQIDQSIQQISRIKQQYSSRSLLSDNNIIKNQNEDCQISRISNQSNFQLQQNETSKISLDNKFNISESQNSLKPDIHPMNKYRNKPSFSQNKQQLDTQNIYLQIGTPNHSPESKNTSKISLSTKHQFSQAPKPTSLLANPLKSNQQPQQQYKNTNLKPSKAEKPQSHHQLYDTSYFSQLSLMSNRSILENKVEDAILKSKIALEKFDQTIKQTKQFRN
ncbi:unnamed protein product [Paramecium pentaurelia]|uniref:non-specific serine/threonine protein kinase n=1 Tax=Paramecium pentaurelia TaxID=43138 RepID=A0A8S1SC07_9CILI|nr:unnamed protein product [Paramecium pentaurelia]